MTEKRLVILAVYVDPPEDAILIGKALAKIIERWRHQGAPIHSWELDYGAYRDPTKDPPVIPQLMRYYE